MGNYLEPQIGPQSALLACPASETFFGGARGGGKTHGLLLDFLNFWQTHGGHVNGAIFRRSYPELEGIIDYTLEMFPQFGAVYSYTQKKWTFPDGAWLILRHLDTKKDAARHQGKQYCYIGVDEIGAWGDFAPLWMLKACLRNVHGIPSRMVLTGNPGGPGQAAIKERYIDAGKPYELIPDDDDENWMRTYIPSRVADNKILMDNDPQYINRLKQVGADWLVKAWLEGDFSAAPDTFLGGIWDDERHICKPFTIPDHWKRFRSLDWGFASPFSCLWYCIDTHGKVYLYRELYGQGKGRTEGTREDAGTIADQILDIEAKERSDGIKFLNNPADTSIWMEDGRYASIFDIFLEKGVIWSKASKGAGSRINGAQEVIYRLVNDQFAVFSSCKHFLKHVPIIPTDPKNFEDVDTEALDHDWDSLRYGLMSRQPKSRKPKKDKLVEGSFDWVAHEADNPEKNMFGDQI